VLDTLLGGSCPCYRIYRCGDGRELSLAALEPKFWAAFVKLIGAEELAGSAFALGEDGARTAAAVERALDARPREHWLRLAAEAALPMGPVHGLDEAMAEPLFAAAGLGEDTPLPGGTTAPGIGPWLPSLGRTPERPAPRLGEHTAAVLEEFGMRNEE
jgi:crotonobetainyl-CoA:carnitine CoA-transferase CaiB-like acyl-CoA transferase